MVRRNLSLARQAAQEILQGIESGRLVRDGGMLPSESELSQKFDVSRATIREALSQLEQRGVVTRRHGVGTFAEPPAPRIEAGLEELESLETLARRIGLETQMGDQTVEERLATPQEAECLQVPGESPVVSVARAILTKGRTIAYLVDIVPTAILQKQELGKNFRGSILDLFLQRSDLMLSHSRTEISVESADPSIAKKLHITRGTPLHKLQGQLFVRDGRIIDFSTSYFVPGYFLFHVIRRVGNHNSR
jgi:GntR family transcriptional regulator